MVVPDRKLIALVMLYSQGIVTAKKLAPSVVDQFLHCEEQMTKQRHYDFGLRALKTLLVSAGGLKWKAIEDAIKGKEDFDLSTEEKKALIMGACNNILPKLVAEDVSTFSDILKNVFPGAEVSSMEDDALREEMTKICDKKGFVTKESFVQKMLQLNQVIASRHGVMVVGKSCVGKVSSWNTATLYCTNRTNVDNVFILTFVFFFVANVYCMIYICFISCHSQPL